MTELEVATTLAARAAALCANMSLSMHAAGLIDTATAAEMGELLRDIARLYERGGDDESAAVYWSVSRRLGHAEGGPER